MSIPDDAFDVHDATVKHRTEKAILVEAPELSNGEPTWIPLICVHDDSEVHLKGDEGVLLIKRQFAEDKGWL
jgi:hypothetical protein